ncbi:MAG: hypothetical protein H6765_07170 [Candidatus Peribacteria bacterium]|nr:MAG: hypothetical protein H6765_07170 [Candidatus Peribacteria bacterium]
MVRRKDILQRYIATVQTVGLVPSNEDSCIFADTADLSAELQQQVLLACQYGFFKGNK